MKKHWTMIVPGALLLCAAPSWAVDLKSAVQSALSTNPDVRQAIENKAATQFERKQAQGLYYPTITTELSAGVRELKNPSRRRIGFGNNKLYPLEADLVADELLFDMGGREAEIRRQAARTDAAAARIGERSQFVALNVSRAYIDYMLQQRLVAIAEDNANFHQKLAGDLREGVAKGSISIADQQQAEERLQSARARVTEAREDLDTAAIEFQQLTGMPLDSVQMPPDLSASVPPSLADAEALARRDNPLVAEAVADMSAAREEANAAKAALGPNFHLEGRARAGHDIDGFEGKTTDLQGRVVMRWTIFNGGTNVNNYREQVARTNEANARIFQQQRQAEQDVRAAWSRLTNQSRLTDELTTQAKVTDDLLLSYREQFNVGRRSLLDVLDAQNTRYNVQAQAETARLAKLYAQYRVLAAANRLTEALGVTMPREAWSNERTQYHAYAVPAAALNEASMPAPVMGPPGTMAPVAPPVVPATQTCADGTVIDAAAVCPAAAPAPTGGR
ncbi:TolC family protein [Sphingomonas sp. ASV193]|uniref:TolC family protein n=1 Tax=Sphingomonas sp. ASV193 TaxID=3144405 RepID=UPI0032E868C9